ncbi:MAG: FlgD immunoglobulin-like domain containing protein, partial [Candidatus Latescibacterota bacterium]
EEGTDTAIDAPPAGTGPAAPGLRVCPNPCNAGTVVHLSLPAAGAVEVAVYGASGQRVRTLFAGLAPAGLLPLAWDGRAEGGRPAASGHYVVQLRGPHHHVSAAVTLVR